MNIDGAGATLPALLYAKWADNYQKQTGNRVNYQGLGSSGGVSQIVAKAVDFACTDVPLSLDKLHSDGLEQFPAVIGAVTPVVNIPGIGPGQLRLTPEVLADIYLSRIRKWNDPAIAELNPGLSLPATDICVVRRADGSGTTWLFTQYLAARSKEWVQKLGSGATVIWPSGLGGKSNEGVAAFVRELAGAIGYVAVPYAATNHLADVLLENRSGAFVAPTTAALTAATQGVTLMPGGELTPSLLDRDAADAWPIAGASLVLTSSDRAAGVHAFFDWAFHHGAQDCADLGYVPLPTAVATALTDGWNGASK